ncbi:MAG: class I SAM-dependent methyltransferase [Pseudomonadota bacterium]
MTFCRHCASDNLELVLDLGLQPWGNHFIPSSAGTDVPTYPLELLVCKDCWMMQVGHTVPKETMFVDHGYLTGTTRSIRSHFKAVADDIAGQTSFSHGDYVLDIGGNDGTFLELMQSHHVDVLNVDSGKLQAERSEKAGVPCWNMFFNSETADQLLAKKGPARIVHGANVLFHVEELHSVFAGIKKVMAEEGRLVAEFVYLPTIIKNNTFDQIYHEHLLYYTLHSFARLLASHRMKLVDVHLASIHGGSCIAYAAHEEESVPPSPQLSAMLAEEKRIGVESMSIYHNFPKKVIAVREALLCLIDQLKAAGKSVQALGAPVKGSTIINYCGLDSDRIDCAVEVNPLKVGTYIPGTRIPVQHQDATPAPDVYLMLAWNFKEEILKNFSDFRHQGGQFIIPFPTPHLI